MTKLKICGMRRMEDIEIINRYKPDFAGFIFAESPRKVSAEQAKEMIDKLDKRIIPVGVFVNESLERVSEIAKYAGLKIIQLHGDESPDYLEKLRNITGLIIWKAFRIKNTGSVEQMEQYPADGFLTDTYTQDAYGGSGKTFRWDLLESIPKEKLVLAGGLTPGNICEAVQKVRPCIVDINSGVETVGYKDENKINLLFERMKGVKHG